MQSFLLRGDSDPVRGTAALQTAADAFKQKKQNTIYNLIRLLKQNIFSLFACKSFCGSATRQSDVDGNDTFLLAVQSGVKYCMERSDKVKRQRQSNLVLLA